MKNTKMVEKDKFKYLKEQKGITLIALVITIIVLLILAGVTIATLTGENGILTRANEAKEETEEVAIKENIELEVLGSYDFSGKININDLNNNLKNIEGLKYKGELLKEGNVRIESLPAMVTVGETKFDIIGDGKVYSIVTVPVEEITTENTRYMDIYGNRITIPAGFKMVVNDNTNNAKSVTEGIVIEDEEENQFVWVPVGKIYTTSDPEIKESTSKTIKLSRYEFADGVSDYIGNDGISLGVLDKGTLIDMESTEIINSYNAQYTFIEDTSNYDNTKAIDINDFKNRTNLVGGFYIARYEASYGTDGKANSKISTGIPDESSNSTKQEGMLWNWITQDEAVKASKKMYEGNANYTSDLINSYAWDTAIVFIQTFGGTEYTTYSRKIGETINNNLVNTGINNDNPLNINDMAGNIREWTTETANNVNLPCTYRGGFYYNNVYYTTGRGSISISHINSNIGFRPIIYLN